MAREKADKKGRKDGSRRKKGPATQAYLTRAAEFYLARYASSIANFKSVLRRKTWRRGLAPGTTEEEAEAWISELADRYVAVGLLDDRTYGRARVESLVRRGRSRRAIRGDLRAKGLDSDLIDSLMAVPGEQAGHPDLAAAIALARRRRLGPFARELDADDPRTRNKALAVFARAGFDYGLARMIIDAEDEQALHALAEPDHPR